jgi:hypothetical protein
MANHARSLRIIAFVRNKSVGQSVHGPCHDFVAIDGCIVKTHFCKVKFGSSCRFGHRIGNHHEAGSSRRRPRPLQARSLHFICEESGPVAADLYEPRSYGVIGALFARGCGRRRQREKNGDFALSH